jgi:hypothetical protein
VKKCRNFKRKLPDGATWSGGRYVGVDASTVTDPASLLYPLAQLVGADDEIRVYSPNIPDDSFINEDGTYTGTAPTTKYFYINGIRTTAADDVPTNSLLRQFSDDFPGHYLGIEYTDTPDGFTGNPDGTYDYSGGPDTVTYNLTVDGVVEDEYTSGIGTSIGSVNSPRVALLSIGRFMNG